jgi:hypothetical protein
MANGFDWDSFPDSSEHKSFDWDAHPDVEETKTHASPLESFGRQVAQSGTLGFSDEIAGAGEALGKALGLKGLGGPMRDISRDDEGPTINLDKLKEAYLKGRNAERSTLANDKKENPKSSLAGELTGAMATSLIPGVGLANTPKEMAAAGAALGGAAGLGTSEADNLTDTGKDILKGAAMGGAGGYLAGKTLPMIANATQKGGDALKKFAEEKAFKTLGGTKAMTKEALEKGNLYDTGRYLLDEGIVTPLASKETIAKRIGSKLDDVSGQFNGLLDKVASGDGLDPVQKIALKNAQFNPQSAAEQLKSELAAQYSHIPEDILKPRLAQVDQWLAKKGPMGIKDAQAFKTQMQKFISDPSFLETNPGSSQEVLTKIRRAIKEGIEDNADAFANVQHGDAGQVKNLNQQMGKLLTADDVVQDRMARDIANRTNSLSDYISTDAGMNMGDDVKSSTIFGTAMNLGNKVIRHRGDQMAATGADKLSKLILGAPRMQELATKNPQAFNMLVNDLTKKMSGGGGSPGAAIGSKDALPEGQAQKMYVDGN